MGEVTLGHEVVRLNGALNVASMDTDSDTHEHVLWSLSDLAVDPQEI